MDTTCFNRRPESALLARHPDTECRGVLGLASAWGDTADLQLIEAVLPTLGL